jgi:hypothetical protein
MNDLYPMPWIVGLFYFQERRTGNRYDLQIFFGRYIPFLVINKRDIPVYMHKEAVCTAPMYF